MPDMYSVATMVNSWRTYNDGQPTDAIFMKNQNVELVEQDCSFESIATYSLVSKVVSAEGLFVGLLQTTRLSMFTRILSVMSWYNGGPHQQVFNFERLSCSLQKLLDQNEAVGSKHGRCRSFMTIGLTCGRWKR